MWIKFNQAVVLKNAAGKEKHFRLGTHDVDESFTKVKYFHMLLQSGLVEDGDAKNSVKPQTLADRQRMLAEKIARTPTPQPKAPVLESPVSRPSMSESSVKLEAPDEEPVSGDDSVSDELAEDEAPEAEAQEEPSSKSEKSSKKNKSRR